MITAKTVIRSGANTPDNSAAPDELSRLRRIAARHDLAGDGLARLVSEARNEARNRRRRLPDIRLEELISDLARDR